MTTITINAADLRAFGVRLTDYVREVVTCGDQPGVLSGAALKGKAKQYGAGYARTRAKVERAVAALTDGEAVSGLAPTEAGRMARVWVGSDGEPVTLALD